IIAGNPARSLLSSFRTLALSVICSKPHARMPRIRSPMLRCWPEMRVVEKSQLMSATEIDRTLQRLAPEIVEKSGGVANLALIGIRRRGVPLAQRIARAMHGIEHAEVPVGTLDITLYRDDLSKIASQPVLHS